MPKYILQRLECLAVATALAATLSSCDGSEQNSDYDELYKSYIVASNENSEKDAIISEYNTENAELSEEIAKLKEELNRRKNEIKRLEKQVDNYESIVSIERAYKLLDDSDLFDKETKEFIKSFLSTIDENSQISLILQAITGDSRALAGYIYEGNASAPLTPSYDSSDLFVLNNTRGTISDYNALYVSLEYSNTYGDYKVYESRFGFIITDSNYKLVAYTTLEGKIVSVSGLNISLVPFDKFLGNIGLSSYIAPVYLPENLARTLLAINKKIAGYQENDHKKADNVLVIDMASCQEYNHIGEHAPYYFLNYIGPDVFNTAELVYQDIFDSDAYFTIDRASGEFTYQHPEFYSSKRGFYLTEIDFSENPLKPLSDLLSEKDMQDGYKNTLSSSELSDIYTALNSEELRR